MVVVGEGFLVEPFEVEPDGGLGTGEGLGDAFGQGGGDFLLTGVDALQGGKGYLAQVGQPFRRDAAVFSFLGDGFARGDGQVGVAGVFFGNYIPA